MDGAFPSWGLLCSALLSGGMSLRAVSLGAGSRAPFGVFEGFGWDRSHLVELIRREGGSTMLG